MNNLDKYLTYSEEDFARDPFFRSWVLAPDEVNSDFWANWLLQYPEKEPVLENARWQMLQLTIKEDLIAEERVNTIWHNIQRRKATIQKEEVAELDLYPAARTKVIPLFSLKVWQQIAAVFLMVSFCAGMSYYLIKSAHQPSQVVSTAFGQTKTVILPDHSEVVLNGNSVLSFSQDWNKEEDRKVSLQGEAFFSVRHTQNHQKFRVKLKDGILVNVLGTKFTITNRSTKTQVVLSEGKVKLTKEREKYYGLQTVILDEEIMKPGDLVEVQIKESLFVKSTVEQPQLYAAFTQNKIIFKNTVLSEVARVLEDNYGYRVYIAKPGLANKRFSGTTPISDINMLFSAIEKLFGAKVIKKGKHIIIQ